MNRQRMATAMLNGVFVASALGAGVAFFSFLGQVFTGRDTSPEFLISDGVFVLVIAIVATWGSYRAVAPRPTSPHCEACGHDLTGNTSGVCPECGKEVMSGKC